jgi:hypothetical protein
MNPSRNFHPPRPSPAKEKLRFDLASIVAAAAFLLCFALMVYTDYKFVGTPDSARDKGRLLGLIPMQLVVILPVIAIIPFYRRPLLNVLLKWETLVGVGLVVFAFAVGLIHRQPMAGIAYDIRIFGWFLAGTILGVGAYRFRFEGWIYATCLGAAALLSWLILKNSVTLIADADEVRQTDHLFAQYTEMIFPMLVYGLIRFSNRGLLVWLALFGIYCSMVWLVGAVAITRTYILQAALAMVLIGISSVARLRGAPPADRQAFLTRVVCAAALSMVGLIAIYSKIAEKVETFLLRSASSESSNSVLLRWLEFRNNFEMLDGPQLATGSGLGCQFLNLHGYTWPFLHLGVFVPLFKFGLFFFIGWLVFGPGRAALAYLRLLREGGRRTGSDLRLAALPAFFTWFAGSCMSGGISEYAFISLGIVYAHYIATGIDDNKGGKSAQRASKLASADLAKNV